MSGLFGVLDVATRAMFVTQDGVRTTAHNIANVDTPGYSRQRQILGTDLPIQTARGSVGTGVRSLGTERITDGFVESQLVSQRSSFSATSTQAEALAQIEQVLNEQGRDGISAALSELYSSFAELSTRPDGAAERESVRAAARSLADQLHRADGELRSQQRAADRRIVGMLGEVNDLAARIAELNQQIHVQGLTGQPNDLEDQRAQLVRELASKIDVQTFSNERGDTVVMLPAGPPLVEGRLARRLEARPDPGNGFDPTFSRVAFVNEATEVDVTDAIGGGELGGLLRVRDDLIPSAIRSLDTLAYNVAETVNTVHAAGTGLDGSSGNLFAALGGVEDAARDLALDPAIEAGTDAIAAGQSTAPGDNRNALALAALRDDAQALYLPGDPPGPASGPSRTLLEHAALVTADVGQQARDLQNASAQQSTVLQTLENRRESISGVNLDEEVSNLVRLQAAFQANARVVSVVERLMQDVISIL